MNREAHMNSSADWKNYLDIIDLPHHVSPTRPRMGLVERGAQFSAFAALNGYESAIKETARLTDQRPELTDEARAELDTALRLTLEKSCTATITYFIQDEKKPGGRLDTVSGRIKRADASHGVLTMESGLSIPLADICDIQPE